MITDAILGGHALSLHRFPLEQKNRSLQAWDAADEYLVDHVFTHHDTLKHVLIFNDSFGSLTSAMLSQYPDIKITNVSDSFIALKACQHNLVQNNLNDEHVIHQNSLSELPKTVDLILMKVPKNAGFMQYLLSKLSYLPAHISLCIAGKAKEIHSSTLKSIHHFLHEYHNHIYQLNNELYPDYHNHIHQLNNESYPDCHNTKFHVQKHF